MADGGVSFNAGVSVARGTPGEGRNTFMRSLIAGTLELYRVPEMSQGGRVCLRGFDLPRNEFDGEFQMM